MRLGHSETEDPLQPVPELWRQKLWVEPLPRNTNPELHPGRRLVRAAALQTRHSNRPDVFYMDVSSPSPAGHFTADVITEGKHVDCLSFRADTVTPAEEHHPDGLALGLFSVPSAFNCLAGGSPASGSLMAL
ncbi:hypothetical protein HPB50_005463 [Hyalomma asiaticum]|uniref:Uncharacterized protein n=1 Tax=Hyalomma asiaticum TaxID=266040 RepID=A0ACB7SSK5_HYAAI|nr:hypothetical protein HPB50_005463 [Hyalomma asiaticum]